MLCKILYELVYYLYNNNNTSAHETVDRTTVSTVGESEGGSWSVNWTVWVMIFSLLDKVD